MLKDIGQTDYDNVFGNTYADAQSVMQQVNYALAERKDKGFISPEQCEQFARDYHLDIPVYIKSLGDYRLVNHRGDALIKSAWKLLYQQILFWTEENSKGEVERKYFMPLSFDHLESARVYGEQTDGKYKPLYSRNYFVPTGYYDEVSGTYNIARPIETFARESGADTSHIHCLLQHISRECYPYVLSWLRAKMVSPTSKTEVVPIFVGAQGTGKSTFGEVICKALFGDDNVLVTDQFDSTARFNADNADALIVCLEEKAQEDKRNTSSTLKSRATARKVRKENKGVDPIFQDSYTDFIMTTNELVPLKFEDRGNQRRFMVMEVDPEFTREKSTLADEVFTRLYGNNAQGERVGPGLIEDKAAIEQFKKELWDEKNAEGVNYRQFPKTEAYNRCFNVPRTNEAIEIEAIMKTLIPFIKASLEKRARQEKITITYEGTESVMYLDNAIPEVNAMEFRSAYGGSPDRIALCRQVIFSDAKWEKPYAHSVVERVLHDMKPLFKEAEIRLLGTSEPPNNGFKGISGKARNGPAAWFVLDREFPSEDELLSAALQKGAVTTLTTAEPSATSENRIGSRVRYNSKFVFDVAGEFETLNELKPDCVDRRKENAQYLDTFLLEADDAGALISMQELRKLAQGKSRHSNNPLVAEVFYKDRLAIQDAEADRLFKMGIVCRVVYSGSKSIHMLVRVEDSPSNLEERNWLDVYLKSTLSSRLNFDMSTKDPTRLTRAPITKKRLTQVPVYDALAHGFEYNEDQLVEGTQRLLAVDWSHIYKLQWRPLYERWKSAPPAYYEERGKMLPSKQVYKDGAIAILEGNFFSDKRWDGIRQDTFFPAYRLLRAMGYTHDELWSELVPGIEQYKKRSEIGYWLTRQDCKLIKTIDKEIDDDA